MLKKIFLSVVVVGTTLFTAMAMFMIVGALTEPAFPGGSKFVGTSMWDDGFVSATGTWTMLNDRPADPIQSSEIRCHKNMGACFEATAKLSMNKYLASALYVHSISS